MESAERLSPESSRVSPCREPGRGPTTATARVVGPRPLLFLLVLALLLASPAKNGPAAVAFAQVSTGEMEPNLSSLQEGSACNTTLYRQWYDLPYSLSGALLVDLDGFWIFSDAELTNGQVRATYWVEPVSLLSSTLFNSSVKNSSNDLVELRRQLLLEGTLNSRNQYGVSASQRYPRLFLVEGGIRPARKARKQRAIAKFSSHKHYREREMSRASHPEACHGVGFGVEAYRYHTHNTSSRLIATTRNNSSPTYVRTSRHVLRSSGIGGGVLVVSSHDGHASPGPSGKERPRAGQVHLRRYVRERMYPERRHSAGGHGAIGLHLPRAVYPAFGPDLPHSWRLVCGQFRKVREGGGER